ncbi:MAG: tRNA pseudouridine(38-40) synthase TruA, partial [Verrucomicrobiota bacterium]
MSDRHRFKLTVAYDGRPFEGWQSQPSGNTIQDHLQSAVHAIHPESGAVHGSGRTDAGVHALAQIAHFDAPTELKMDASAWLRALNTKLPRTIRMMNCEAVDSDFHARFSATGKTYQYDLFTGQVLPPLRLGLAWHVTKTIDLQLLKEAALRFEGRHDFAAFAANRGDPESNPTDTRRTIFSVQTQINGPDLRLTFHGEGFLYKMVR